MLINWRLVYSLCARLCLRYTCVSESEGGPGKQVTTTGVGPGNISRWKLFLFEKFEFEERGYFGTTIFFKKKPGNARQRPGNTR